MTFSDGGSMTILVTQYKCHYYAFVMKTHIFSDDNGSRIVKSLVVAVSWHRGQFKSYRNTHRL